MGGQVIRPVAQALAPLDEAIAFGRFGGVQGCRRGRRGPVPVRFRGPVRTEGLRVLAPLACRMSGAPLVSGAPPVSRPGAVRRGRKIGAVDEGGELTSRTASSPNAGPWLRRQAMSISAISTLLGVHWR